MNTVLWGVELKMQACWEKAYVSCRIAEVCVPLLIFRLCVYWVSHGGRAAPGDSNEPKLCSNIFPVCFILLLILHTAMPYIGKPAIRLTNVVWSIRDSSFKYFLSHTGLCKKHTHTHKLLLLFFIQVWFWSLSKCKTFCLARF